MDDRELLELAAKAAGYKPVNWSSCDPDCFVVIKNENDEYPWQWNPLTDGGDALRLAVRLDIDYYHYMKLNSDILGSYENDPYAATRRAIVRAAAEIGKGMK